MKRSVKITGILALAIIIPVLALASGGKAFTASNGMLQHVFRSTSYTAPTNTYVGLLSTCPTTGNTGTEQSGNGYTSRSAAIAKGDSSWTYTAATYIGASTITNAASVAGSTAWTASGSSWTLNCFGVYDAATTGNLLYWGPLTGAPVTVGVGATASFPIGSLTITEN
jgi:hypothetical protein